MVTFFLGRAGRVCSLYIVLGVKDKKKGEDHSTRSIEKKPPRVLGGGGGGGGGEYNNIVRRRGRQCSQKPAPRTYGPTHFRKSGGGGRRNTVRHAWVRRKEKTKVRHFPPTFAFEVKKKGGEREVIIV
eukprot:TRINITY_DN4403_c0_g1_i2.p1 TRINITY_DN4403_c0_g1~~TRINITY_DN4403_c0_g1_i2.p1  ORF type:complete len:128 (-),score=0.22 TRINITY_DN4403_c0_g1_i2:419-802(-)